MEASGVGERPPNVAPPPDTAAKAGWTPADPGPLGLAGFAMTTFVLSMYNADLINIGGTLVVLSLALAYGGIVQLIAGIWEFRTGNTFGAVAFCSFGGFWIAYYLLVKAVIVPHLIAPGVTANAISVFLYGWAIFTTYMLVASLRTTGAVAMVFLLLSATFWILAIGNASLAGTTAATNSTIKLGGWFGLATAAVAWYASFAAVTNATWGRVVLPVFPLKR